MGSRQKVFVFIIQGLLVAVQQTCSFLFDFEDNWFYDKM